MSLENAADETWWSRDVWACSDRAAAAVLILLAILGVSTHALSQDSVFACVLKLAGGSLAVTLVPGALILLAWQPGSSLSILEMAGLGLAIGFGLMQLLTVFALLLHLSSAVMLVVLCVIAAVHGAVSLSRRSPERMQVTVSRGELLIVAATVAVAAFAYLQGSPYNDTEDHVHIAIARRLAQLPRPALDNIYYAPHIVYTYPFPGTHYMMALMSKAGGIDTLFLYHKLRAFWMVAAILLLYGCARIIFESRRLALASALVAVLFVANGTFATVGGFFWGQLAPNSHAADVAMGALLPALLLLGLNFVRATERRAQLFFLMTTMTLAFMLMVVHTREIVQFVVYLTAFALSLFVIGDRERLRPRVLLLLGANVLGLAVYARWHSSVAPLVDSLVAERRQDIAGIFHGASLTSLFGPPIPLLSQFFQAFGPMFYGWNPIVLLAAAPVLYRYRDRPLVLLIGASIVSYLLIIRIPLLAIGYVWATYFEILFTPVRNVVFFIHMLAGVLVYTVAVRLAALPRIVGLLLALIVSAMAVIAFRFGEPLFTSRIDLLFVPAIAAYIVVACWISVRRVPRSEPAVPSRTAVLALVIVLPVAVFTRLPDSSPLNATLRESVNTPAALVADLECQDRGEVAVPFLPPELESERIVVATRRSCPPTRAVINFAAAQIPADAVFAIDKFSMFPAPVFMPQQVVMWPSVKEEFLDEDRLFSDYFRQYRVSMLQYRAQPFFNDRESAQDRLDFVRRLGVTHVLVEPWNHDLMARVLSEDPNRYRRIFDEAGWSIYQVNP